jgi:hypothetical protein
MNDKKKKTCSGFPEGPGKCNNPATAVVSKVRQHVCEEHAKQASANGHAVHRQEKKS